MAKVGNGSSTKSESASDGLSAKPAKTDGVAASKKYCLGRCSRRTCRICWCFWSCIFIVVLTLFCVAFFGFYHALLNDTELSFCGINATDESSSYIAYAVRLGVYNPAITAISVPQAHIALVSGTIDPDFVAFELEKGARKSVDYGALAACDWQDITFEAGKTKHLKPTCVFSQYSTGKRAIGQAYDDYNAGKDVEFTVRYHFDVKAFGLGPFTFRKGYHFSVNKDKPTDFFFSVNDQHCGAWEAEEFDMAIFVTGSGLGMPKGVAEAKRLIHACSLALCEQPAGAAPTTAVLTLPPSELPIVNVTAGMSAVAECGSVVTSRLDAMSVISLHFTANLFNPMGIGAEIKYVRAAVTVAPTEAVWGGSASASVVEHGAVAACETLDGDIDVDEQTWHTLTVECALAPNFEQLVAQYSADQTLSFSATVDYSAKTFGITLKDTMTQTVEVSRAIIFGDETPPRDTYTPSPHLPVGAASCAGVSTSAAALEAHVSPRVNATLAALLQLVQDVTSS